VRVFSRITAVEMTSGGGWDNASIRQCERQLCAAGRCYVWTKLYSPARRLASLLCRLDDHLAENLTFNLRERRAQF
jgi:hypothetical protein